MQMRNPLLRALRSPLSLLRVVINATIIHRRRRLLLPSQTSKALPRAVMVNATTIRRLLGQALKPRLLPIMITSAMPRRRRRRSPPSRSLRLQKTVMASVTISRLRPGLRLLRKARHLRRTGTGSVTTTPPPLPSYRTEPHQRENKKALCVAVSARRIYGRQKKKKAWVVNLCS